MRVILEEIENETACLISEEKEKKAYYVDILQLPKNVEVGDVLKVTFLSDSEVASVQPLKSETTNRIKSNRKKREQLLKRKKRRK